MQDSTKKRGRPRSFDSDAALVAASEQFRASGFTGTSLDDLAAATRLNRPSLYAAFGDKKSLYLAALDRTHARIERAFDQLEAAALPLKPMLEAMFGFVIDGFLSGCDGPAGCIMISTAATEAVVDTDARDRIAAFLAMEDERIERLLLNAGDPDAALHARIVAATVHSLSVRSRAGANRAELDRVAGDCIALVTRKPR